MIGNEEWIYMLDAKRNVKSEAGWHVDTVETRDRHVRLIVDENLEAGQAGRLKLGRAALDALVALDVQQ